MKYEFRDEKGERRNDRPGMGKINDPFKLEVDYIGLQLASFRRELRKQQRLYLECLGPGPHNSAFSIIPTWTKR